MSWSFLHWQVLSCFMPDIRVKHLLHSITIYFYSCLTAPETIFSLILSLILLPHQLKIPHYVSFGKVFPGARFLMLFQVALTPWLSDMVFIFRVFRVFLNMHSCILGKLYVFFSVASSSVIYFYTTYVSAFPSDFPAPCDLGLGLLIPPW